MLLAQYSIAPSLDFTLNANIQSLESISQPFTTDKQTATAHNSLFKTFAQKNQAHFIERSDNKELKHWKSFFDNTSQPLASSQQIIKHQQAPTTLVENNANEALAAKSEANHKQEIANEETQNFSHQPFTQLHQTYILSTTPRGFMLIHQQLAHERILYERYSKASNNQKVVTQKSLFPINLELGAADTILLVDLLNDINALGYDIEPFGNNSFVIQGTPADVLQGNEKHSIELLLEQFKHFSSNIKFSKREKLVRCLARQNAVKAGQSLSQKEMQSLVSDLFLCQTPNTTVNGNPTFVDFKEDYLDKLFTKW
jgi:DNA mismatch repair protein MutL